jgi:hypothetical protein
MMDFDDFTHIVMTGLFVLSVAAMAVLLIGLIGVILNTLLTGV